MDGIRKLVLLLACPVTSVHYDQGNLPRSILSVAMTSLESSRGFSLLDELESRVVALEDLARVQVRSVTASLHIIPGMSRHVLSLL